MTCIAALVKDGRVYMAGDSCQTTEGGFRTACPDPKVWKAGCFLVGECGSIDFCNLLRYRIEWPAKVTHVVEHMLVTLPDDLREVAKRGGFELPDGGALIGVGGAIYELSGTEVYRVAEPYAAHGSGYSLAMGVLAGTTEWAPRKRLTRALEVATRHRADVCPPFHFETL